MPRCSSSATAFSSSRTSGTRTAPGRSAASRRSRRAATSTATWRSGYPGRVGFEAESLAYARYEALAAGGIELVARRGLVEQLREVKDSAELAAVRRSAAILTEAFARLAEEPFVGRTERDLVWRMAELMHEGGADDAAFSTAVGAGETGSSPHAVARRPPDRGGGDGRRRRRLPRQRVLLRLHADVRHRGAAGRARGGVRRRPARAACVARRRSCPARTARLSTASRERSSRTRGSATSSGMGSVTASGSRCTRRPGSTPSARARSRPEMSSPSSRVCTSRGSAASASRTRHRHGRRPRGADDLHQGARHCRLTAVDESSQFRNECGLDMELVPGTDACQAPASL